MSSEKKVYYISLGCFKNLYDTEDISGILAESGFSPVQAPDKADIIFINTCSFIGDARKESEEVIHEILSKFPEIPVIVGGCMVKYPADKLLESFPQISGLVAFEHYSRLGTIAKDIVKGKKRYETGGGYGIPWWHEKRLRMTPGSYAYLKISEGCKRKCTFCTIPKIRGPFISQHIEVLVERALILAVHGVKEIILISQDSTSYGVDLYGKPALGDLIKELVRIDGLEWIRVLYLYPGNLLTHTLIDTLSSNEKVCSYFDVPLQHVSEPVLKRMGRKGSLGDYRDLITKIRSVPGKTAIRTTFITGFPGETEEDFNALYRFVEEMEVDHMGCFAYSDEQATPSFNLDNKVDAEVGAERKRKLMLLQKQIVEKKNRKEIGAVYRIAVDGTNEKGQTAGHTQFQCPEIDNAVLIKEKVEPGSFVDVEIVGCQGYDLVGKIKKGDIGSLAV